MLKNSTKLTSLVVAAATVASMTPAFAAEKKIADKDGTIYNAIAYKDGKFYIDGDDLADNDDSDGVYFLEDGKYKEVDDDVDSGDEITDKAYGEKYIEFGNGDYYLDLTNGKLTDDYLKGDDREDAASNLKKKLRKDDPDRYTVESRTTQAELDVKEATIDSTNEIEEVASNKFVDPYYKVSHYKFAGDKAKYVVTTDAAGLVTTADTATIYTDKDGKYIDVDNDLGKVNLVIDGETLAFDEVGTKKSKGQNQEYVLAIEDGYTLGSDDKYIYRKAFLHVGYVDALTKDIKYFDASNVYTESIGNDKKFLKDNKGNKVAFGSKNNPIVAEVQADGSFVVIQKISKEQGDDKDDAKLPKTTVTYFANEYKEYGDKYKKAEFKRDFFKKFTKDHEESEAAITVTDGRLNSFGVQFDDPEKFGGVTLTLSSKNGFYYVDQSDADVTIDDDDEFAFDSDVKGNAWILNHGKISKYAKGDIASATYKVDGGYNKLSVYDENNLIAYNEDDNQYAIVGGKSSTGEYEKKDENTTATTTTAAAGWVQNADGTWSYNKADGTKAIGWLQSPASGLWYYMDANGIMMSNGWVQDGAYWYYLKADGAMATGWIKDKGTWYFLKKTPGNRGAMQTGWIQDGGKWYYCNASGAMLANTTVGGYKLGADGAWIK